MEINYKQIIFAREYRGYSQTELASKIVGLSQSNLSKYEKGIGPLSTDVLNRIIDFQLTFMRRKSQILQKMRITEGRKE